MPVAPPPAYRPPLGFANPHVQTIFPSLLRRVRHQAPERERLAIPDGDFLDLDWYRVSSGRLMVCSHGLEGRSDRPYMRGMARAFNEAGWDALAWNYRGCSGETNRTTRSYHSGATDDLEAVVQHAFAQGYAAVGLVGFSLGGNLTLKYLGERGDGVDDRLLGGVAFSVPCDLAAAAAHIDGPGNAIYRTRFLRSLVAKARAKHALFPDAVDLDALGDLTTLVGFDDLFTAPLHGFTDAADYYARSSANRFLPGLRVPALLVTAADDPFLPPACYPYDLARDHLHLTLEVPRYGGHVGFVTFGEGGRYWSEQRAVAFLEQVRHGTLVSERS